MAGLRELDLMMSVRIFRGQKFYGAHNPMLGDC